MSKERNEPQEPPLEWFVGLGYTDGIDIVSVSDEFLLLGDELPRRWNRWSESMDPHNRKANTPEGQQQVKEDASYIREKTGFTPKAILNAAALLTREFRNKKEAPFPVDLCEYPRFGKSQP